MYHNYYYGRGLLDGAWIFIVALIIAIILMLTFLSKNNKGKYHGFLKGLYDFLNFRKLTINAVLRLIYLVVAITGALSYIFSMFSYGIGGFFVYLFALVVYEIVLRLGFELIMLLVVGVSNIIEINEKLNDKKEDKFEFYELDTDKYASKITEGAEKVIDKIKEKTKSTPEEKEEVKQEVVEELKPAPKARKPRARKPKVEKTEIEKAPEEKE